MRLSDIVARAEQAQTLSDLRRAVVDWMLLQIQLEAERANKQHNDRTREALGKGLQRGWK